MIVTFGAVVPGGFRHGQLRKTFAVLDAKLQSYDLAAHDLRDAFNLAGENAINPDAKTAAYLTLQINAYNAIYDDLRIHQLDYNRAVTSLLAEKSELALSIASLIAYALEDVHQSGILQFNDIVIRKNQETLMLQRSTDKDAQSRIAALRASGASELRGVSERVDKALGVLASKLAAVRSKLDA
jgi:hypothetical protein